MSLTIELSPHQEQLIRETAAREGVSVDEIIARAVSERFPPPRAEVQEFLARCEREDALASDEERAEDERIFAQLHANINETRQSLGMRLL